MENKTIVINKIFSKENMLHLWNKIKNRFTDTEKKMNMIKVFMEKYYASPSGTATYTATISEWNGMSKYELIGKSFVGVISDTTPFPTSNELIIRVNDNVYNVVTTGGRQITSFDGYNLSNPMMFIFKTPDTLELKDGTDIGNINGLPPVLPNNMVGAINTTYSHSQKVENDVKSINNKRLESMEEIDLTTEEGFYVGALAAKELGKTGKYRTVTGNAWSVYQGQCQPCQITLLKGYYLLLASVDLSVGGGTTAADVMSLGFKIKTPNTCEFLSSNKTTKTTTLTGGGLMNYALFKCTGEAIIAIECYGYMNKQYQHRGQITAINLR